MAIVVVVVVVAATRWCPPCPCCCDWLHAKIRHRSCTTADDVLLSASVLPVCCLLVPAPSIRHAHIRLNTQKQKSCLFERKVLEKMQASGPQAAMFFPAHRSPTRRMSRVSAFAPTLNVSLTMSLKPANQARDREFRVLCLLQIYMQATLHLPKSML